MPAPIVNLQMFDQLNNSADINAFQRLPFYLAQQEARRFPQWKTWATLFATMKWTQNMGDTLRGVSVEYSPNNTQEFLPEPINNLPLKDVLEIGEVTNEAVVRRHKYRSKLINFLPSFQDFRKRQLDPRITDMGEQIVRREEQFLRTYFFEKCPYVYICGKQTRLTDAPVNPSASVLLSNAYKNTAYRQALVAQALGYFTLRELDQAILNLRDSLEGPAFESQEGKPQVNELLKGKYCLVGSLEWFQSIKYDPQVQDFKALDLNLLNNNFRGSFWGLTTFRAERFPYRIAADGTLPAPQVQDNATGINLENPDYANAPYEIAWLHGADTMESLGIGAPPAPFSESANTMSVAKFSKMNWNGVVKITDQLIVPGLDSNGDAVTEYNADGEWLQLHASVVHGAISNRPMHSIPIVYRRRSFVN